LSGFGCVKFLHLFIISLVIRFVCLYRINVWYVISSINVGIKSCVELITFDPSARASCRVIQGRV
jgi:hypothetical protein